MYDDTYDQGRRQHRGDRGRGDRDRGDWGRGRGGHGGFRGSRSNSGDDASFYGRGPERGGRRGGGTRRALLTLLREAGAPRTTEQLSRSLASLGYGRGLPLGPRVSGRLQELETEGLVRGTAAEGEGGNPAARSYELTEAGTAYLDQAPAAPEYGAGQSEGSRALRQALFATAGAARQVAVDGDPETAAKATELLHQARKGIYRLLAGDPE